MRQPLGALPLGVLLAAAAGVAMAELSGPAPPKNPMASGKQMAGPKKTDSATVAAWHADMHRWRAEYIQTVKYNGSAIYNDPQLAWTQTSFMQPQMHPCEQHARTPYAALVLAQRRWTPRPPQPGFDSTQDTIERRGKSVPLFRPIFW